MGDKTAIKPTWDPYKLMNVTRNELEVVAQRKKMKEELKVKWQRISTNPHVSASGGGHFVSFLFKINDMHAFGILVVE